MSQFYVGIVENRDDPLKLGRCQVRIIGLHTQDKNTLPTVDLPWAYPLQPISSAAISGIGSSPTGLVEGASVVVMFPDAPDNQQPIIMGSLGGIPQTNNTNIFGQDIDDRPLLKNIKTGQVEPVPVTEEEVKEATAAEADPVQPTPSGDIPTDPPPSFKGDRAKAKQSIIALLAACDKLGMTTREQKCAVLGIVGGESGWIPKEEGFSYSAERLATIFPKTFKGKPELAAEYARWKGTRADFFRFVYAPENNGSLVGNTQPDDGAKYYGKGFIQLTGRPNYTLYSRLSGVDILTNPDLLNTDIELSAQVAVAFVKNVAKKAQPTDHPGYFYAAKKGVNPFDNLQPKLGYYEYFYGNATPASSYEEKDANVPPAEPVPGPANEIVVPGPQGLASIGFKDPNGKYPLKKYIHEPDTNRLARGISEGTVVLLKDANRVLGIPIANDDRTFDEPKSPFGARYPFNHVRETESGHVQEFDDTPGKERIHTYHRKGTFSEVDENGTEVRHIVGDSYTIVDRNGCIYITGECNLTARGNINIMCQSDANIEVEGDTKMTFGGNLDIGVAKNMNLSVGGSLSIWTANTTYFQTGGDMHLRAGGKWGVDATRTDMNSGTTARKTLSIVGSGSPIRQTFEYLQTSSSSSDRVVYDFETEEEWATPAGQAAKRILENQYPLEDVVTQEEAPSTGGSDIIAPPSCEIIFATDNFTADFRLSQNFTLGMFFDGGFNKQHTLADQNGLTKQQIVCNLSQLAQNILEPALSFLPGGIEGYNKQWRISSGYRQGTSNSQHNKGQACDIALSQNTPNRKEATFELVKVMEQRLPYDQIILEYRGTSQNWIHTSFNAQGRRKQAFTMLNDSTYPSKGQTGFFLV